MTEWYRTGGLEEVGNRFAHRFTARPVPVKSNIWKNVRKHQREGIALKPQHFGTRSNCKPVFKVLVFIN